MAHSFSLAANSAGKFMQLGTKGELTLGKHYLNKTYIIKKHGYRVFRETDKISGDGETVILVIGFRLKALRSNRYLHWLFQRVCILTTPFWSGLPGFKVKLWMVDPDTQNYLGIYNWYGKKEASQYINFLLPILKFFSVAGTVWAEQIYGQQFDRYLRQCQSQ